jgi:hypothetical protein
MVMRRLEGDSFLPALLAPTLVMTLAPFRVCPPLAVALPLV